MPQKLTRREFAAKALAVGAAAAIANTASAQDAGLARKPAEPPADPDYQALLAKLEKPLPKRLETPAKNALKNIRNSAKERLKYKLPEGSEPCTSFVPLPPRSG